MPDELVLLTNRPPTSTDLARVCATTLPGATVLDWATGTVRQVLDRAGHPVLAVYTTRTVDDPDALPYVVEAAGPATCWTDLTVPEPAHETGTRLAHALADQTAGTLVTRR